jgi:hypothetical protein
MHLSAPCARVDRVAALAQTIFVCPQPLRIASGAMKRIGRGHPHDERAVEMICLVSNLTIVARTIGR